MRSLLLLFLLSSILSAETIRVATYNASLAQSAEGDLLTNLQTGTFSNAKKVAEIVQMIQPDVLLINEFDYVAGGAAATSLNDLYFKVSQNGRTAQDYPHRYVAISNTGIHSGFDLDNANGIVSTPGSAAYGGDAFGFGEFPGKYGMAVFSKYPFDANAVRTFEEVLWNDMPDNVIPYRFFSGSELNVVRLSSKSHWDIPIQVAGTAFHFLVSHPTPPVFDGPEDRNGRRNHDEIRLWADYITPGSAGYLGGGLSGKRFVIAGDQNADPNAGDSFNHAINQLLNHPRVDASFAPIRSGNHTASNQHQTSTFGLRVDYTLPSKEGFHPVGSAVFWPTSGQDGANLVTVSDHRPVYVDLKLVPLIEEAVKDLSVKQLPNDVELSWEHQAQVSYKLEQSADLKNGSWQDVTGINLVTVGERSSFTLPRGEAVLFYRIAAYYE